MLMTVPVSPVMSATAGSASGSNAGGRTITEAIAVPTTPPESVARNVRLASVDSVTVGATHVATSAVRFVKAPPMSDVRLKVIAWPSGSIAVAVRFTTSPASTVIMSATCVTTGARLARTVTLICAVPTRLSSGLSGSHLDGDWLIVVHRPRRRPHGSPVVAVLHNRAERADVRGGRERERERVGRRVWVGRRAGELDCSVPVDDIGACLGCDDGGGVLVVVEDDG